MKRMPILNEKSLRDEEEELEIFDVEQQLEVLRKWWLMKLFASFVNKITNLI
jgi:hypothetical protein